MKKIAAILILLVFAGTTAQAAFPTTFATLTGNQPLSLLDNMFGVVGSMGQVMCTASGTNAIALTPVANMPTIGSYSNYQEFGFVAAGNSTGSVTENVSGVGALPLYLADGATQAGSASITGGAYYLTVYNSALNSGSGGFQVISQQTVTNTGTISAGTGGQLAGYLTNGTTISGLANATLTNGSLTLGQSGTAGAVILNGSSSGTATINVPALAGSTTITLPANNGSANQFLQTNGSGTTSWGNPSSTLMTPLAVGSIIIASNNTASKVVAGGTLPAASLGIEVFINNPTFGAVQSSGSGDSITGTWKALQTVPATSGSNTFFGLWQRISQGSFSNSRSLA